MARMLQSKQDIFLISFCALFLFVSLTSCGGSGGGSGSPETTGSGGSGGSTSSDLACPGGMVKFTGGTFTMGDNTDPFTNNPEHTVTLSDFCLDAAEV
ncbi:MAG: hypothetical protein HQK87_06835, partial [Nitrospinae bacterium]|nr:hypothetical protein [Nitrospinota bacterium]